MVSPWDGDCSQMGITSLIHNLTCPVLMASYWQLSFSARRNWLVVPCGWLFMETKSSVRTEGNLRVGKADICLFRELQSWVLLLGSRIFLFRSFSNLQYPKPTEKMPYSCWSEDVMTIVPLVFNKLFSGALVVGMGTWNGNPSLLPTTPSGCQSLQLPSTQLPKPPVSFPDSVHNTCVYSLQKYTWQ